jgi:hypothetical protein
MGSQLLKLAITYISSTLYPSPCAVTSGNIFHHSLNIFLKWNFILFCSISALSSDVLLTSESSDQFSTDDPSSECKGYYSFLTLLDFLFLDFLFEIEGIESDLNEPKAESGIYSSLVTLKALSLRGVQVVLSAFAIAFLVKGL